MSIKYVPTTKESTDTAKETEIVLVDRDFMIYNMLKEILAEMQRARTK
jgi:hypothetical protein